MGAGRCGHMVNNIHVFHIRLMYKIHGREGEGGSPKISILLNYQILKKYDLDSDPFFPVRIQDPDPHEH